MSNSPKIELFSAQVCPYAHRTRLALLEKGLDVDLVEIDFKNKPARFLKISAYGKVPAIVHNGAEIYESAIINEYLEEVFPEPALMPNDPVTRAKVRIWIDYCDDIFLTDFYGAMRNQDRSRDGEFKEKIETHLRRLENGMASLSESGPFWLGEKVCLMDLAIYPFFERLPAWEHYRGITIPEDCTRLKAWRAAMEELPSVKEIATPADYYIERYINYANPPQAAE